MEEKHTESQFAFSESPWLQPYFSVISKFSKLSNLFLRDWGRKASSSIFSVFGQGLMTGPQRVSRKCGASYEEVSVLTLDTFSSLLKGVNLMASAKANCLQRPCLQMSLTYDFEGQGSTSTKAGWLKQKYALLKILDMRKFKISRCDVWSEPIPWFLISFLWWYLM